MKKNQKVKSLMKKQNEPKKTNYYSAYTDSKPSHIRRQEALDSIPEHCWWLKQYLRGIFFNSNEK